MQSSRPRSQTGQGTSANSPSWHQLGSNGLCVHQALSCHYWMPMRRVWAKAVSSKPEARDVRPVPIKLITVSKGNSSGAKAMADEWLEKARRYTQVTENQIKPNPKKAASVAVQKAAEGDKVLKALSPGDLVVLLDERGRDLTSEGMARLIASAGDKGATCLTFCIGGPFGHSDDVRARANDSIKLSSMVLNHQVAYIVLVEQIYRGWTILRGEPYHH